MSDKVATTLEQAKILVMQGQKGDPGGVTTINGKDGVVVLEAEDVGALPETTKYAASKSAGGPAEKTAGILSGAVDDDSTATAFSATVPGLTALYHGAAVLLKNGVVTSAAGCTLDVNGLGAKPIYNSMETATAVSTTFNAKYTMLFIYDEDRVEGGCWLMYYGYNANTTYSNASLGQGYVTCDTAEATAAKAGTLTSYALTTGGIVAVRFKYNVPANATLNIRTRGAKAIRYRGEAITAGVIKADDIAVLIYDGSYYHLLAVDRWGTDLAALEARVAALENS